MKKVVLSADSDYMLYLVDDEVADHLHEYCLKFANEWVYSDIKYRCGEGVCFDESDFIEWLNKYKFPDKPSFFVENLGNISPKDLPEHCKKYKKFNF